MSEADYSQGAKDERERIVAWLRDRGRHYHKGGVWVPRKSILARWAALIERGDHLFPVPPKARPFSCNDVLREYDKSAAGAGGE